MMEQQQHTEIDAATWDEVTATDEVADSFAEGQTPEANEGTGQAENEPPAGSTSANAPADQAAADSAPSTPPADPYAGLPEPVRQALAAIPTLEQQLRSTVGRVGALQRELAQVRQAPAPAPEAPATPSKLEALRAELPEVAEALEEVSRHRGPTPEELKAELFGQLQEELLDTQRSTWAQELTSNEFQTWLGTQAPDFQEKVRTATRAPVILGALSEFDKFKEKAAARANAQQRNQSRLSAAVTPSSGARRAPAKSEDDMTEDELWDHITR